LRGTAEVVRHCFERFVEDGTPPSEWPHEFADVEVPQGAPEFHKVVEIPDEVAAVATVDFKFGARRSTKDKGC
jgi:hypothetical protein